MTEFQDELDSMNIREDASITYYTSSVPISQETRYFVGRMSVKVHAGGSPDSDKLTGGNSDIRRRAILILTELVKDSAPPADLPAGRREPPQHQRQNTGSRPPRSQSDQFRKRPGPNQFRWRFHPLRTLENRLCLDPTRQDRTQKQRGASHFNAIESTEQTPARGRVESSESASFSPACVFCRPNLREMKGENSGISRDAR
jgi:hypothetical protein